LAAPKPERSVELRRARYGLTDPRTPRTFFAEHWPRHRYTLRFVLQDVLCSLKTQDCCAFERLRIVADVAE